VVLYTMDGSVPGPVSAFSGWPELRVDGRGKVSGTPSTYVYAADADDEPPRLPLNGGAGPLTVTAIAVAPSQRPSRPTTVQFVVEQVPVPEVLIDLGTGALTVHCGRNDGGGGGEGAVRGARGNGGGPALEGLTVCYTEDESIPFPGDAASKVYSREARAAVDVTTPGTRAVLCRGFAHGMVPSPVAVKFYTVRGGPGAAVSVTDRAVMVHQLPAADDPAPDAHAVGGDFARALLPVLAGREAALAAGAAEFTNVAGAFRSHLAHPQPTPMAAGSVAGAGDGFSSGAGAGADAAVWLHGALSRRDAEALVAEVGTDGAFLVREKPGTGGGANQFVLVVQISGTVRHHLLVRGGGSGGAGGTTSWCLKGHTPAVVAATIGGVVQLLSDDHVPNWPVRLGPPVALQPGGHQPSATAVAAAVGSGSGKWGGPSGESLKVTIPPPPTPTSATSTSTRSSAPLATGSAQPSPGSAQPSPGPHGSDAVGSAPGASEPPPSKPPRQRGRPAWLVPARVGTKAMAEAVLADDEGTFLVRFNSKAAKYVVMVHKAGVIKKYTILQVEGSKRCTFAGVEEDRVETVVQKMMARPFGKHPPTRMLRAAAFTAPPVAKTTKQSSVRNRAGEAGGADRAAAADVQGGDADTRAAIAALADAASPAAAAAGSAPNEPLDQTNRTAPTSTAPKPAPASTAPSSVELVGATADATVGLPNEVAEVAEVALSPSWLVEKMANNVAAALVADRPAGTFVVRRRNGPDEFALTVVYQGRPTHHLIKRTRVSQQSYRYF
jgi:hypothetical protein